MEGLGQLVVVALVPTGPGDYDYSIVTMSGLDSSSNDVFDMTQAALSTLRVTDQPDSLTWVVGADGCMESETSCLTFRTTPLPRRQTTALSLVARRRSEHPVRRRRPAGRRLWDE